MILAPAPVLGAPSDAANILKSVLSRGEIRIIAATTLSEYKAFVQEDEAFARRFRTVVVKEPKHRGDAPDPREACGRGWNGTTRCSHRRRGARYRARAFAALPAASAPARQSHRVAGHCVRLRRSRSPRGRDGRRRRVGRFTCVADSVRYGLPRGHRPVPVRCRSADSARAVIGQRQAIRAVARLARAQQGTSERIGPDWPDGVLLFLGPTGVGKTELAKAAAEFLFGDERRLIRPRHVRLPNRCWSSVDKLIGMPRGIVGSEQGGIAHEPAARQPLLCACCWTRSRRPVRPCSTSSSRRSTKAGLRMGEARRVYLSDTIVIMTSNLGLRAIPAHGEPTGFPGGTKRRSPTCTAGSMREVERRFSPEFRNRIDEVVIFDPLTREEVETIARQHIERLTATLKARQKTLRHGPRGASNAGGRRLQPRVWRAVPQARGGSAGSSCRSVCGGPKGPALRRWCRTARSSSSSRPRCPPARLDEPKPRVSNAQGRSWRSGSERSHRTPMRQERFARAA